MTALQSPTSAMPIGTHRPARASVDGVVRQAAGGLLWLALLLVTYWWVADGGLRVGFAGGAAVLALGQLTGLVASVLLLAQVLLMARIPVLERASDRTGSRVCTGWSASPRFNLMLAHIVLITWGYAAGRPARDARRRSGSSPSTTPACCSRWRARVCLVMVVVTSVRAARRRLRYESWHLLHLYAYLGVGLALPHQLWTGRTFLASPAARVFWWTAVGGGGCRDPRLAARPAGVPDPARTISGSPRSCTRPTVWSRSTSPAGDLTGLAVEAGPVLHLAVPGRSRLDAGAPLLAVRGTRRAQPADHRQGPRRRQPRRRAAAPRHPGPGRGPVRTAQRAGADPAARSRSSARASASPRCGPSPRGWPTRPARPSCCSGTPTSRCSLASSTPLAARARPAAARLPGPPRAGLLARRGAGQPTT